MFLLKNAQKSAMSCYFPSFQLLLKALALPLVFPSFNQAKVTVAFLFSVSSFPWDVWSLTPALIWTCVLSRSACPREAAPAQAPDPAGRPAAGLGRKPGEKSVSKTQHLFLVLLLCFHQLHR